MGTIDLLEKAYISLLAQGIVSDSLFISTNKFSDIKSRNILTMSVYHSNLFKDDDFMMSNMGLFRDVVDFYTMPDGSLDYKIAIKIKSSFQ